MRRTLAGTRATTVSAVGTAILIEDLRDVGELPARAVVVTSAASPDLVLVVRRAVGIVTETGGPASHAAILAREFGIACSVGVSGAMSKIPHGVAIRINGATGEVDVLH